MILSSKQLEELENLQDSVSEFDEEANISSDSNEFDEVAEGALAWRRGMLERSVATVKKIDKKPLSSKENYSVGTLVFDALNNRFARVKKSSSSEVELAYVSGGEGVLRGSNIQRTAIHKALTPKKPVAKKAEPKKVEAKKPIAKKKPEPKKTAPKKKKAAPKKPVPKKKKAVPKKAALKKKKPRSKKPITKKKPVSKKPVAKKKPVSKKKAVAKKKPANPNSFIKQNYKKMSNKELSAVTGLSEHTIRRKLGEWGLKRPAR